MLSNSDRGDCCITAGLLFEITDARDQHFDSDAGSSAKLACKPFW